MSNYRTGLFAVVAVFLLATHQSMFAQANRYSRSAVPPIELVGKFLVHESGNVTTFRREREGFRTRTNEYYFHSQSGRTGKVSRAQYANGMLLLHKIISPEQRAELAQGNPKFDSCGTILAPPVRYRISAVRVPGEGGYYIDRWDVAQFAPACRVINVRHHSRDDSCETWCVEAYDELDASSKNMRLYSRERDAMADARAR